MNLNLILLNKFFLILNGRNTKFQQLEIKMEQKKQPLKIDVSRLFEETGDKFYELIVYIRELKKDCLQLT
jgi:hypothetical protein